MDIISPMISKQSLQQILSYIPYFSNDNEFATIEYSIKNDIVIYSSEVKKFVSLLSETNFIITFNWAKWDEGRRMLFNEDFTKIPQFDLLHLRMLMTTIVRKNRLCTDCLLIEIENGLILKILLRLKELLDNDLID